ncbi:MAG TPA: lipopolysaccharide biosynthesis protein [Kofleriaceae bacterium]|nr:lipopolysaccharide biosynthesis protein [Kofleriaceae bacterium]
MSEGAAQTPPAKGLGKRTLEGITWTLVGQVGSNALRIAVLAILGRLLAPAEFGQVAAGLTVIALALALKNVGVGLALVQRREIDDGHVEAAFGFSLLFALALAGATFACAPLIADLYDIPESASLLRALSVMFLLRGIASTSSFLCQRDMSFRALATIDFAGYAAGSVTSVVLAFLGVGAWSLVIGYLVEAAIGSAALLYVRPPPLRFRIRWHSLRDLLGFGGGQTAAGIANYFANQGDYVVVGRYLDAAALGFYTRAYELIRYPSLIFNNVFGTVFFSSFSKLQDDPDRLGVAFRRVLFVNAVLLLPASAGVIVLAPEAIRLIMGPGWDTAVLPFQIMAVSMLFRTSYKAGGIVARSSGDVFRIASWQAVYAVVVVGGALLTVRWGITGVSCTTALAVIIHFFALSRLALRRISLGWGALLAAHVPGLIAAGLAVAGAAPVAHLLRQHGASAITVAVAGTVAGSIGPVGFFLLALRRGHPDWVWVWQTVRQLGGKKRRKAEKRARRLAEQAAAGEAGPGAPGSATPGSDPGPRSD